MNLSIFFVVFVIGFVFGVPKSFRGKIVENVSNVELVAPIMIEENASLTQDAHGREVKIVADLIDDVSNHIDSHLSGFIQTNSSFQTGSVQEIQTIKDYLIQLKDDIRSGASSYVQDSVSMMEELTTAIKHLKKKMEVTVNRVNSKAESKLLAIKAIEELIGFSNAHHQSKKNLIASESVTNQSDDVGSVSLGNSLLEVKSSQEIQTIKDYLEQLKSDIRSGVTSYVQDSVAMMEELTTAIKNLKKRIEGTVNRVNSKAEAKLLAIKAIEELVGFSHTDKEVKSVSKSLVQYGQTPVSSKLTNHSVRAITKHD